MREKSGGEMFFAPLERSLQQVIEKRPTRLEESLVRVEKAFKSLFKFRDEDFLERSERRRVDPAKAPETILQLPSLAVELPHGIIADAREDFVKTFPRYATEIEATQVKYLVGFNKLTDKDKTNFLELLQEKDTLMGEAYPFYQVKYMTCL